MKFIYFKSKNKVKTKVPLILEIIGEAMNILKYESDEYSLTIYYSYSNIEIKDLTNIIISELFEDITIYESLKYNKESEMIKSIEIVKNVFETFEMNHFYVNNKTILKSLKEVNEMIKKLVLNKYYNDKEMYLTIKTFLEHNQNVSKASEYLYIHRNTLNQRLNKFEEETSFNVKKFIDGYLIYKIL